MFTVERERNLGAWGMLVLVAMLALTGCAVKPMKAISRMSQVEIQPEMIRVHYQNQVTPLGDRFAPKGAPQGLPESASSVTAKLTYGSYIGGDNVDYGKDVAVDAAGNIYVLGQTFSDTLFDAPIARQGYSDIFVAKFDPTGSTLLYSTIVGGGDSETPLSIAVDSEGNVWGTTYTSDENFPVQNALWPTQLESTNGVLFKLDATGALVYSTYLPFDVFYSRHNLAVDGAGNVYVTGSYPWVITEDEEYLRDQIALVKLDPTGQELLLDVMIGGNGTDRGVALALDDAGNIYLAGTTSEGDGFPVTANAHQTECGDILYAAEDEAYVYCYEDAVVVVLNPAGEVIYASYHGGSFTDAPNAIGTDGKGNIMIAGDTASSRFPFVNAIQDSCQIASYSDDCESGRVYVSLIRVNLRDLSKQGEVTFSTYLAASERNSANTVLSATMDRRGNMYVAGYTSGKQFPRVNPVQDELFESFCYTFSSERYCFDAFVTMFSPKGEMLMSSYLGADFDEYPYGLTVDRHGTIYVVGTTEASEFPTTSNAYEASNLLNDDAFLVKIEVKVSTPTPPRPAPLGASSEERMKVEL